MYSERFLGRNEAKLLLDLSISDKSQEGIIVVTTDEKLLEAIDTFSPSDENIVIKKVASGCDALVVCARNNPDLLIIDDNLPDIPSESVINCLRRDENLKNVKILIYLSSSHADVKPDLKFDDYILRDELDPAFLMRKIHSLLYTSSARVHRFTKRGIHYERRWPRIKLNVTVKIEMYNLDAPEHSIQGDAIVEDISRNGAYISKIKLQKQSNPGEQYQIKLSIDQPPLTDWEARSKVVRLKNHESAGVTFSDISKKDQLKIAKLFNV